MLHAHDGRDIDELRYGDDLFSMASGDPLIGELAGGKLTYYASTTRQETVHMGRITTLIENGKLFDDLGIAPFDPATDRVMICGSMDMIRDVKALIEARGFKEGSNNAPAEFVVERAFVG